MSVNTIVPKPLICGGHSRPVPFISYSRQASGDDCFYLASACLDGKAMLRYGNTGDWIGTFLGHKGAVWGIDINEDGTRVVTGSADYTARVWNATNGEQMHSFEHTKVVKSVCFDADASNVISGGSEGVVRVFDISARSESVHFKTDSNSPVRRVLYSSETPASILSADSGGALYSWDRRSGESAAIYNVKGNSSIRDVGLTHDGKRLVISAAKSVLVIDAVTFDVLAEHTFDKEISTAALDRDDAHRLAVGFVDELSVQVCTTRNAADESSGATVLETLRGHHGPVHCVRYAPDFNSFASSSEDGTIRLWQTDVKSYGLWQLVDGDGEFV